MKINTEIKKLYISMLIILLIWSILIVISLFWNLEKEKSRVLQLAEVEAKTNLGKDLAFRLWATKMGGLYVKVTPEIQPSPFMSHIPNRDITTPTGDKVTLYNPAIILRLLMKTQAELYGVKARITGEKYLNPGNAPDEWEQKALKVIKQTLKDFSEVNQLDGEPVLRYMQPMIMKEGCLKCHAWTNIKVGDLRGATDVAIPLAPYYALEQKSRRVIFISHGSIWLLGSCFIIFFSLRRKMYLKNLHAQQAKLDNINQSLQTEIEERIHAETQLRLTSNVFKHTSEAIVITDANSHIIDCNQAYTDVTGYTLAEIKGKNPNITSSGHHDKKFYLSMWKSINTSGSWTGEIWDRRKNGELYPQWLSVNSVKNENDEVSHYIGVFTDISHLKETEKKLENLAFIDVLTGLPNRHLFHDRLAHELSHAHRQKTKVTLFFIDLDQFKRVNDTLGHFIGDELLQEVAQRIKSCVRENDTVSRLGGDEFTIILTELFSPQSITDIANKIIDAVSQPINLHDNELFVGASIGVSIYPDDGENAQILIRNADAAMYHAKDNGRGNCQFFSEEINQRNQERHLIEKNLRQAIKNEEFELYYQPQIDISSEKIIGAEALIRWNDPQKGLISPLDFIPIAEENGMILEIGNWVFKQTCRYLRRCIDSEKTVDRIAINLSAVQFKDEGLVDMIESVLKQENIPSNRIELEITESAIMENADEAIKILERLSALDIKISIDDFGTGYSSLAYLKKFPVDKLKIDREFIKNLPDNNDDIVLTTTMIKLANSLGIDVLAEGAETKEQVEFLEKKGCQYVQGYYYSKPLPEDEFYKYLLSTSKA